MLMFPMICDWPEKSSMTEGRMLFSNSLSAGFKKADSLFKLGLAMNNFLSTL